MDKTYHFLAGLPRSGNTLLSSILNQNPDIYSSPLSPVAGMMWDYRDSYYREAITRNIENKFRSEKFLSSFMGNFYNDIKKPIVIDREKTWGTPGNLSLIKEYITPTPKIIFTVRDVLDIIASIVRMDSDYLKRDTMLSDKFYVNYLSEKDCLSEYIIRPGAELDRALLALATAFLPENKGMFHIVEYKDLVLKPEETMSGIYKFLELPEYKHNFKKIEKVEVDDDESIGLPKNVHEVRKSLSKSTTNTDILSDYIKHKYSNMEFWRKDSLMKVKGKDF
jgi:sulfotransferase